MKQFIFICLSYLVAQSAYAFDPRDDIFKNAPITICDTSPVGKTQYDLKIKGNLKIGVLDGISSTPHNCGGGNPITVKGQYGAQDDGSLIVTLVTLNPPGDQNCDAWAYQVTWKGTNADGEITFKNTQKAEAHFELGACDDN